MRLLANHWLIAGMDQILYEKCKSWLVRLGLPSFTIGMSRIAFGRSGEADLSKEVDRETIQRLAYRLWQERGCPVGSPEIDWFHAEQNIRVLSSSLDLPFSDIALEPQEE